MLKMGIYFFITKNNETLRGGRNERDFPTGLAEFAGKKKIGGFPAETQRRSVGEDLFKRIDTSLSVTTHLSVILLL